MQKHDDRLKGPCGSYATTRGVVIEREFVCVIASYDRVKPASFDFVCSIEQDAGSSEVSAAI